MKYKDSNNEWQELVVRASDTLPIGAEVDYDGDTVPYGWEEAGSDDYSTEETFTGKYWIDGRPIYRKVAKFNPTGTTFGFNISLSPHEVDFVWLAEPSVCFESANGNIYPITGSTYNPDGDYIFVRFVKENSNWFLDLRADSLSRISEALITLEYVKVTD